MATVDDKKIIFSMVGLNKTIQQNNKQVLKNIYLSFFYGAKIGIIGLNGSGKSTLLKIIAGLDKSYQGEVVFSPGYSVGYLAQEPYLDPTKTVKEIVMEGVQPIVDALAEYEEINQKFGLPEYYEDQDKMDKLFSRQAELQDIIDATDAWNLDSKLERAMDALRCPPEDQSVEHLSGGERRRVALCRLLLQKPDVLLLDEPTNHLDAESIDWLEQHLQQYEGTVIAVTHDRYFLDHVAGWILELDRGEGIPWKGNYSSWLEQKTKRMEQEEKTASKRRKTLERELEWVRMAPKARQAKSKARINAYEELLSEASKEQITQAYINIPMTDRLGDLVIEAKNISKSFGDRVLIDNLSFKIPKGAIVGIIGPNGAGKTTIFNMLTGVYKPTDGIIKLDGEDLVGKKTIEINKAGIARTFQNIRLFSQQSVLDNVKIGLHNQYKYSTLTGILRLPKYRKMERKMNEKAMELLKVFELDDKADFLASNLPYGEQRKLEIARALATNPKLLLLDEPAAGMNPNETLELMETIRFVREHFDMTILLIEHDMKLVGGICEELTVLNFGRVLCQGKTSDVLNNPEVIKAYLGE